MCRKLAPLARSAALACLAGGVTVSASQQLPNIPHELLWVGLFNRELVGWLENENRLAELCTPADGPEKWADCKEAHLEPKVHLIAVRAQAREDAPLLGTISVVALPGRGLRGHVSAVERPTEIGAATPFTPDLFDPDWAYGPYFHQTVLERRGTWYRIPIPTLPPGWVNAATFTDAANLETINAGDIVVTPRGDMTVIGVGKNVLRVRPEQEADMWCRNGQPPALQPWTETKIPFRELIDSRGHLLLTKKYTRGC